MKVHELKCWPAYFDQVLSGEKNFEVRWDDRGFRVGDHLLLREWDPHTLEYSGRAMRIAIRFVLSAPEPSSGLKDGYCVLGLGGPLFTRQEEVPIGG